jgi:hypothetical protein
MVLIHEGNRLRLLRCRGWELDLVDDMGEPFLVGVGACGQKIRPDVDWLLAESSAGRLFDADDPRGILGGKRGEFLGLDREACIARDPKSAWKHAWAMAALQAGIRRSETGARSFVSAADPPPTSGPRPKWRSLLRWVAALDADPHRRIGNLVSTAGREVGQSQLPEEVDVIVHREVGRYWSSLGDPFKADAAARIVVAWDELEEAGVSGIGEAPPSEECVRQRINALQNRATYASRNGEHAARRYYAAKGEPVTADGPLDRVTLDGVVFKHVCVFSEDWKLPAAKMKGVFAFCSESQFAFPGPVFSGPFRAEATVQALLGLMTPPRLTADQMDEDPRRAECFGTPTVLHPDNEKALLPPAMVPNLVNIVPVLELPKAYHSDAKAKHERFHRFLKGCVSRLMGRVLGPGPSNDPRYDPLTSADVIRLQYVAVIGAARVAWNERPKKSLGWRTPTEVLFEGLAARGRRMLPPAQIERHLSRSVKVVLTTNGVEYDGIRYRYNERGIEAALDANVRRQPFAKRLEDTGRCALTARVWDGDLDHIDLYDPEGRTYHRLHSTEPDYTAGLTRHEHHEYRRMLAVKAGGSKRKANALRRRAVLLKQIEDELPKQSFRARAAGVAVLEQEEARMASGHLGRTAAYDRLLVPIVPTDPTGEDREDEPVPPPQPSRPLKTRPESDIGPCLSGVDPDYPTAGRGAGIEEGDDEGRPVSIWDDARTDDDDLEDQ